MEAGCSPGRKPGDPRQKQWRALEEGDRNVCHPAGLASLIKWFTPGLRPGLLICRLLTQAR